MRRSLRQKGVLLDPQLLHTCTAGANYLPREMRSTEFKYATGPQLLFMHT